MKQILLIEDDINLKDSIKKILEDEGFKVTVESTIASARLKINNHIDLVVLDWMLPDGQGIDFLKELRLQFKMPVIMLTARTDLIDKVLGLESGANDYMTKPFESRELIARIRVQLRDNVLVNKNSDANEELIFGKLTINIKNKEVQYNSERIILTKMEYELIKLLAENPKQTFSRENLLDKVWGYENYPTTRTVDNHVLQIRQKTNDDVIETIRGIGYRLGNPI